MTPPKWTTIKVGRKVYHVNVLTLACGRSIATVHDAKGKQVAETTDFATPEQATAQGVRLANGL